MLALFFVLRLLQNLEAAPNYNMSMYEFRTCAEWAQCNENWDSSPDTIFLTLVGDVRAYAEQGASDRWSTVTLPRAALHAFMTGSVLEQPPQKALFSVQIGWVDSCRRLEQCSQYYALNKTSQFSLGNHFVGQNWNPSVMVIDTGEKSVEQWTSGAKLPTLGWENKYIDFLNKEEFPYFSRINTNQNEVMTAMMTLVSFWNFARMVFWANEAPEYQLYAEFWKGANPTWDVYVQYVANNGNSIKDRPEWATMAANVRERLCYLHVYMCDPRIPWLDFFHAMNTYKIIGLGYLWLGVDPQLQFVSTYKTRMASATTGTHPWMGLNPWDGYVTINFQTMGRKVEDFWHWWKTLYGRKHTVWERWMHRYVPDEIFKCNFVQQNRPGLFEVVRQEEPAGGFRCQMPNLTSLTTDVLVKYFMCLSTACEDANAYLFTVYPGTFPGCIAYTLYTGTCSASLATSEDGIMDNAPAGATVSHMCPNLCKQCGTFISSYITTSAKLCLDVSPELLINVSNGAIRSCTDASALSGSNCDFDLSTVARGLPNGTRLGEVCRNSRCQQLCTASSAARALQSSPTIQAPQASNPQSGSCDVTAQRANATIQQYLRCIQDACVDADVSFFARIPQSCCANCSQLMSTVGGNCTESVSLAGMPAGTQAGDICPGTCAIKCSCRLPPENNLFFDPDSWVAFDAVWASLLAINNLLVAGSDLDAANLQKELRSLKFEGVTGWVQFNQTTGERAGLVYNIINNQASPRLEGGLSQADSNFLGTGWMTLQRGQQLVKEKKTGIIDGGVVTITEPMQFFNGTTVRPLNLGKNCSAGHEFDPWTSLCNPCPPGKTINEHVAGTPAQCVQCQEGRYSNQSASTSCRACTLGAFSSTTGNSLCTNCSAGAHTGEAASVRCTLCGPGRFSLEGAKQCDLCNIGRYSSAKGASWCSLCPRKLTTKEPSQIDVSSCVCNANTLMRAHSSLCQQCEIGLVCRVGSNESDFLARLAAGQASVNEAISLAAGFWSSKSYPFEIYKCVNNAVCPGGVPGSCGPDRVGASCAHCRDGYYLSSEICKKCSSQEASYWFFPGIPLLLGPILVVFIYGISKDGPELWNSWTKNFSCVVYILMVHYQHIVLINSSSLQIPNDLKATWDYWNFVFDFLAFFRPTCAGFASFGRTMMLRYLTPSVIAVYFFGCWAASYVFSAVSQKGKMDLDMTFNNYLSILYIFFNGLISVTLTMFKCSPNPCNRWTLIADRTLLCYEKEWGTLIGAGIAAFCIYGIGFPSLIAYAIKTAPSKFPAPWFQKRWKFLFIKYRNDRYWWSLAVVGKGLALNVGCLFSSTGTVQLNWILLTAILYAGLLVWFAPWRHKSSNLYEVYTLGSVIICTAALMFFTDRSEQGWPQTGLVLYAEWMSWCPCVIGFLVSVFILCRAFLNFPAHHHRLQGLLGDSVKTQFKTVSMTVDAGFFKLKLQRKSVEELTDMLDACGAVCNRTPAEMLNCFQKLSFFDQDILIQSADILLVAMMHQATTRKRLSIVPLAPRTPTDFFGAPIPSWRTFDYLNAWAPESSIAQSISIIKSEAVNTSQPVSGLASIAEDYIGNLAHGGQTRDKHESIAVAMNDAEVPEEQCIIESDTIHRSLEAITSSEQRDWCQCLGRES